MPTADGDGDFGPGHLWVLGAPPRPDPRPSIKYAFGSTGAVSCGLSRTTVAYIR